jgi:hypothetical protein
MVLIRVRVGFVRRFPRCHGAKYAMRSSTVQLARNAMHLNP